jgi:hypothetical protein
MTSKSILIDPWVNLHQNAVVIRPLCMFLFWRSLIRSCFAGRGQGAILFKLRNSMQCQGTLTLWRRIWKKESFCAKAASLPWVPKYLPESDARSCCFCFKCPARVVKPYPVEWPNTKAYWTRRLQFVIYRESARISVSHLNRNLLWGWSKLGQDPFTSIRDRRANMVWDSRCTIWRQHSLFRWGWKFWQKNWSVYATTYWANSDMNHG